MGLNLISSGQNAGTLGVITSSPSSKKVPAGCLIVAFGSAAVANNAFSGLADNGGVGNVYNLSTLLSAGINESALLGLAVAAGDVPQGSQWSWTFAAGTPGGRMFSVGYFDDALGVGPVFDQNPAVVSAAGAGSIAIASAGLAQAQELVIMALAMRSGIAGGTDSITFDGSMTAADIRNHTATTQAYQGWAYKYVNSQNALNDSASFLSGLDNSIAAMQTVKLAIPSIPSAMPAVPNHINHPGYQGV